MGSRSARVLGEGSEQSVKDGTNVRHRSPHRGPAKSGSHHRLHSHRHGKVRLIVYPGESTHFYKPNENSEIERGAGFGHIYVEGSGGDAYPIMTGPPPEYAFADEGGHTAGPTTAGVYVLAKGVPKTSKSWPRSVVPFGADVQFAPDGHIQFKENGHWKDATGRHGKVTEAVLAAAKRAKKTLTFKEADDEARKPFFGGADGKTLLPKYVMNDFGAMAWNLQRDGRHTELYIHTTAKDELFNIAGAKRIPLSGSHGCIHITIADREEMVRKNYLRLGMEVVVMPYRVSPAAPIR